MNRRVRRRAGATAAALKHSDGPWMKAAGGADALVTQFAPVRSELALAHQGLMAGAGRLTALAELAAVRESWERRIQAARGSAAAWRPSCGTSHGPRAPRTRPYGRPSPR